MHPNDRINHLLTQLNDELCQWERSTGVQCALIVRDQTGWKHRSLNGKPGVPDDVLDHELFRTVRVAGRSL